MRIVNDKVIGHMGDVLAQKVYGQWDSKDPTVLAFIAASEKPVAKKAKVEAEEEKLEMTRARDENGHFVSDDPATTDVNEAWIVKTVKKARKK
jgi:hypothetical protein